MPDAPNHRGGLCNCFDAAPANARSVDANRFSWLPEQTRRLVGSWFQRAWDNRNATGEDVFEPFVFAWIAFNGWAACVTEQDGDREYLRRLMASEPLCERFKELSDDMSNGLFRYAEEFSALWPIFEVKHLRRQGVQRSHEGYREDIVARYLQRGARRFEPQCWVEHQNRGEPKPIDLPHTLAALYRVRCNLFHGEKVASSEADQRVVGAALRVLVSFMREGGYL